MKLIKPNFEIISYPENVLENIEKAARTCYKSEDRICKDSAVKIVKMLLSRKHMAMIEFGGVIYVKFKVDRSMSHELVRHRLASFAQESQRYIKYDKGLEFVYTDEISCLSDEDFYNFCITLEAIETTYKSMLKNGTSPQTARAILPNCTATEINVQANVREWLHILELRCSKRVYPPLRRIMLQVLESFYHRTPILFNGLYCKYKEDIESGETNVN